MTSFKNRMGDDATDSGKKGWLVAILELGAWFGVLLTGACLRREGDCAHALTLAGPLADKFSRTRTASLGGAVFCVGSILAAAASNLAMLFVGRCIAGVGEGLFLSSAMVYLLEIAPTNLRGRLSCTQQLFVTLGLAAGKCPPFSAGA